MSTTITTAAKTDPIIAAVFLLPLLFEVVSETDSATDSETVEASFSEMLSPVTVSPVESVSAGAEAVVSTEASPFALSVGFVGVTAFGAVTAAEPISATFLALA